jgi:hypothetical protein
LNRELRKKRKLKSSVKVNEKRIKIMKENFGVGIEEK